MMATVFTGNDVNSKAVLKAFQYYNVEFVEINLRDYPSKAKDLESLSGSCLVPTAFFGGKALEGVDAILQELRRRANPAVEDHNTSGGEVDKSRLKKLELPNDLEKSPDPFEVVKLKIPEVEVNLPDGTRTTHADITEKLKNILPLQDRKHKGVIFRNTFTGTEVVNAFSTSLNLSSSEAEHFSGELLSKGVFCNLKDGAKMEFVSTEKSLYRLQCHMTPGIINSYRIWKSEVSLSLGELVSDLHYMLCEIEFDAVNDHGLLDILRVRGNPNWPKFEEAVCELQKVKWNVKSEDKRLTFCLNLYKLMIRYAFIKVGIPVTEDERLSFLNHVKFNLGGIVFTFHEFIHGIIRGNRASTFVPPPFSEEDMRLKYSITLDPDSRILYALYGGHEMGCQTSVAFDSYRSSKLNAQLTQATQVFWREETNLKAQPKSSIIYVTEVMGWYRSDFPSTDDEWLDEIAPYLDKQRLRSFPDWTSSRVEIEFTEVTWTGNYSGVHRYNKDDLKGELKGLKVFLKRFKPPATPKNESIRLKALEDLKLLDTMKEERFDRITRMVQYHFAVPIVLVSLVDANRQWFKSVQWNCANYVKDAPAETGRDISFCGHVVLKGQFMVIEDSLRDDRFADNPLVTGDLKLRFYAGYPLMVPGSEKREVCIGTLCLLDQKPRRFSKGDQEALKEFANQIKMEVLRRES